MKKSFGKFMLFRGHKIVDNYQKIERFYTPLVYAPIPAAASPSLAV